MFPRHLTPSSHLCSLVLITKTIATVKIGILCARDDEQVNFSVTHKSTTNGLKAG